MIVASPSDDLSGSSGCIISGPYPVQPDHGLDGIPILGRAESWRATSPLEPCQPERTPYQTTRHTVTGGSGRKGKMCFNILTPFSGGRFPRLTCSIVVSLGHKYVNLLNGKCFATDTDENLYTTYKGRGANRLPPYLKYEGNKRVPLTFKDHVTALCEATGEDLVPWLRDLGTTIE